MPVKHSGKPLFTGPLGARERFDEHVTDVWAGPLHYDVGKARSLGISELDILADVRAMYEIPGYPTTPIPVPDSIAKRLFAGRALKGRAKGDLTRLLMKVGAGFEDYSFDPYDGSLELFGPALEPTKELTDALREAGFERVWVHKPECPPPRGNDCKCTSIKLKE